MSYLCGVWRFANAYYLNKYREEEKDGTYSRSDRDCSDCCCGSGSCGYGGYGRSEAVSR